MISTLFMGATGKGEYVHLQDTHTFLFFQENLVISMATRTAGITQMYSLIPERGRLVI
jgi:hypothetical protein